MAENAMTQQQHQNTGIAKNLMGSYHSYKSLSVRWILQNLLAK
jgi:hypothetical protein